MKDQLKDTIMEWRRIKGLIARYQAVLSLTGETIDLKEGTESYEAELGREGDTWVVYYNNYLEDYYIAHELGHIHLAKVCEFPGFAKPMTPHPEIHWNIQPLLNVLLDGFVDYHLSQFPEIYPAIKEKLMGYLDDLEDTQKHFTEQPDYIELLRWYLVWYLDFFHVLRKDDGKERLDDISFVLKFLRSVLRLYSGGITDPHFDALVQQLDRFGTVKQTTAPDQILAYCAAVLESMGLWAAETIQRQIALFFGIHP